MAFEYSESAYGLRTFGSSVGEVQNASATVTVTSSIANVNWAVAIGAEASLTATASITCSGEVVIIEDSSEFSYGSGLYGANNYGIENLQTIVSATSSIANVNCIRKRLASATVTVTSTVAAIGGFTANASATVTATSTTASTTTFRVRLGSATVTVASSITSNATATYNESVAIAVVAAIACSAEKFFLESSDKFVYGSGLYGRQVYDAADLQTIISATSVGTTCTAAKVNLASATVTAVSSTTTDSEKIHQEGGTVTATSTSTSRAEAVYISSGTITATGVFTQTTTDWRVRESTGIVSSTSGTATIGREKWEVISVTPITWTQETNDSVTWTQIAA